MPTDHLPIPTTSFVGRDEELSTITTLLADPNCRLLTLVAAGGIGKTRLALQAAAEQIPHFAQGVYFVSLNPVHSPDLIAAAMANALQISLYGSEDSRLQIVHYLREKHMLLVMDNFEHLLGGTGFLTDILQAATGVKFLATSRERLNIQEEWVLDLEGLSFPDTQATEPLEHYSAVQLFIQRARQIKANFSLSKHAEAVKTICQRVEGMPLGLELAATWLRAMPCEQIATQLEGNLNFLTTPLRNVPERHRSLRIVFDQSWNLLSTAEKNVLMRLSVFRGGFDLEAAEQVAGASLSLLAGLTDKSLIRLNASERYDLHELLRQYGQERLWEDVNTWQYAHDRHCSYYANFLCQSWEHLTGSKQKEVVQKIEIELDNVRAYWDWAVRHQKAAEIEQALNSLWLFYDSDSRFQEGEQNFARAAAVLREDQANNLLVGKVLVRQGALLNSLERVIEAKSHLQEGLAILQSFDAGDDLAFGLFVIGALVFNEGFLAEAREHFKRSLALYREKDNLWGMGQVIFWLGIADERGGDLQKAQQIYRDSLRIFGQLGDVRSKAQVKSQLSQVATQLGNYDEAQRLAQEGLLLFQEMHIIWGIVMSHNRLAHAACSAGNYIEARQQVLQALSLAVENHLPRYVLGALKVIVRLRLAQRQTEGAVELLALPLESPVTSRSDIFRWMEQLKNDLPQDVFDRAVKHGGARDLDATIIELLAELQQQVQEDKLRLSQSLVDPLTERELEIVRLMADGLSNAEIALALYIGLSTVKVHSRNLFSKLNVSSRTQAIRQAQKLKLFK